MRLIAFLLLLTASQISFGQKGLQIGLGVGNWPNNYGELYFTNSTTNHYNELFRQSSFYLDVQYPFFVRDQLSLFTTLNTNMVLWSEQSDWAQNVGAGTYGWNFGTSKRQIFFATAAIDFCYRKKKLDPLVQTILNWTKFLLISMEKDSNTF